MPRKHKYFSITEENNTKNSKQAKIRYLAPAPLLANLHFPNKLCFSGDIALNMNWLKGQVSNQVEVYDKPFKGTIYIKYNKELQIAESFHFSKTYQHSYNINNHKQLEDMVKDILSLSNSNSFQIGQMVLQVLEQARRQTEIAIQLLLHNIKLTDFYDQLYLKSMAILNQLIYLHNFEGNKKKQAYVNYAIQSYNFTLHQMEKSSTGGTMELVNFLGLNLESSQNFSNEHPSCLSEYIVQSKNMNPFMTNDTIDELLCHTRDGVVMKALYHQRVFNLLPHNFFVLKVRFFYFDDNDIKKLMIYRQTKELIYPLQLTDLSQSNEENYKDYTPDYNLDEYNYLIDHPLILPPKVIPSTPAPTIHKKYKSSNQPYYYFQMPDQSELSQSNKPDLPSANREDISNTSKQYIEMSNLEEFDLHYQYVSQFQDHPSKSFLIDEEQQYHYFNETEPQININ